MWITVPSDPQQQAAVVGQLWRSRAVGAHVSHLGCSQPRMRLGLAGPGQILQQQHVESRCPGGAAGMVAAPGVRDTAMGDQSSSGHGSSQT